jgi:hypothetical protein
MKIRLLAAVVLTLASLAPAASPVSAVCNRQCETYRVGQTFCSSCCMICVNAQGNIIYNNCDTFCMEF